MLVWPWVFRYDSVLYGVWQNEDGTVRLSFIVHVRGGFAGKFLCIRFFNECQGIRTRFRAVITIYVTVARSVRKV